MRRSRTSTMPCLWDYRETLDTWGGYRGSGPPSWPDRLEDAARRCWANTSWV